MHLLQDRQFFLPILIIRLWYYSLFITRYPLLFLLLLLTASPASAQVSDTFADGDFTAHPAWTGDLASWTVTGNALRSNAQAASDTIHLATPSRVAFGSWSFTFSYGVNLSNYNGARVFLVSDHQDLEGDVHGYFVQLGTNNGDEIRLYRQDGDPSTRRVELAA
ncbi:MAG TPA: hypothetical protein VFG50_12030, partial [Rhodothermales bacterium]|nr:hypothetical protein [Rhodothermales bacterium]